MEALTSGTDLLDDGERMSLDELRAVQLERLRATVRRAYNHVPRQRDALDAAGVHPEDVRSLDDLADLPFTTKDDLRAGYPFGTFAVPMDEVVRVHASSGTTGRPTVVGYTRADVAMWAGVVARSLRAAGVRPGMRVHVAYGYGLFTGGLGAHYGAEALGCTVVPMSGGQTQRQVQLIQDFEPDVILVTPSYMLALLDAMRAAGVDPAATSLKVGVFGAEPWTEAVRSEVEDALDMHAVDIYGLSEVIGPGVSQECVDTKDGLHVWEDHFYPEVVDPETGEVLPDGERGELVFTSLTKQAMPIVRYRTRDLTRLLPGTARPTMRRMEKVTGRTDDMLILRGVNLFPSQVEELLLDVDGLSPHFQLRLERPGRMDELTVVVERRSGVDDDAAAQAGQQLARAVKDRIGVTVEVEVTPVDGVPRSQGKATRVVDHR